VSRSPPRLTCRSIFHTRHRPRLSLFHYERDRNKLELWPLFSYAVDPATKEKRLRLLLTAVQYQATATAYDLKVRTTAIEPLTKVEMMTLTSARPWLRSCGG
jgi:hypothetical protein